MDLPRKFSSPRFANQDSSSRFADTFALVLWATSTYWFKRKYYVHDRNLFNWALFSVGSFFASSSYGKFLFESSYNEAVRLNNERESQHLKSLGHH